LTVDQAMITGWVTGIRIADKSSATISSSTVTGNATGIAVGSSASDACTLKVQNVNLSGNTVAISNSTNTAATATLNWWGSQTGPNTSGSSPTTGLVNFSPWLGNADSLELNTPNSLGFTSAKGLTYEVSAVTVNGSNPGLNIKLIANPVSTWSVLPTGTVLFN